MLKRLFRSAILQNLLASLLAGYMRLIKTSTRWEVRGQSAVEPLWQGGKGIVGTLWHSQIMMALPAWPMDKQTPAFLISQSPDGAFVAKAANKLGVEVIRGSAKNTRKTKKKGGSAAFRQMITHVQNDGCMAITPDGPRGPAFKAGMGAVKLAKLTGAPIVCLACSTARHKVLASWDRFILPFPFGRGVRVWKGPIRVPSDADDTMLEEKRILLQTLLNEAHLEAEAACGHLAVEDAP